MYFGAMPVTSWKEVLDFYGLEAIPCVLAFENGYTPAATWLPIVARIKDADTKNLAARESNLAITAGMYLVHIRHGAANTWFH